VSERVAIDKRASEYHSVRFIFSREEIF
jgi:hypothetical protein